MSLWTWLVHRFSDCEHEWKQVKRIYKFWVVWKCQQCPREITRHQSWEPYR